jgi:hypothetical protein
MGKYERFDMPKAPPDGDEAPKRGIGGRAQTARRR